MAYQVKQSADDRLIAAKQSTKWRERLGELESTKGHKDAFSLLVRRSLLTFSCFIKAFSSLPYFKRFEGILGVFSFAASGELRGGWVEGGRLCGAVHTSSLHTNCISLSQRSRWRGLEKKVVLRHSSEAADKMGSR
jgi:hypothetical protein